MRSLDSLVPGTKMYYNEPMALETWVLFVPLIWSVIINFNARKGETVWKTRIRN